MTTYRTRRTANAASQAAGSAVAVPQVVPHQRMRRTLAGPVLSERDLTSAERWSALAESWGAMAMQSLWEYQRLVLITMQPLWFPWASTQPSVDAAENQSGGADTGILPEGVVPIRKRAIANATRLGRTRF